MSASKLIVADRLSKTYRVYASPWRRLIEPIVRRPHHRAFAALDDVSFELRRGESLGIVGENGAGKSTLLKLVSGVTAPTRGTIAVRGKVASLLELGMGFHPEFSGRRNIRLNAAMMGVPETDLEHKLPEIVAFSELGEFIDRPVKTYSTGMAMRLGFAIAVQVDPEILVIDEALSVGDGYFQKKCMDRLLAMVRSGVTLLFCSHAMYYVSTFCQRAIWLRHGRVAALGPVDEVIREYENFLLAKTQAVAEAEAEAEASAAAAPARIREVRLLARGGEAETETEVETRVYHHRESWTVEVTWRTSEPALGFHVGVGIDRIDGVQIVSFGTHTDGLDPLAGATRYTVRLTVPELPMLKGEYTLYVFLLDEEGLHVYDRHVVQSAFSVAATDFRIGLIEVDHRWDLGRATAQSGSLQPEAPQPAQELAASRR